MSGLALARSPITPPAWSRSRRPAAARVAVRAVWPFSARVADTADASSVRSPSSPPDDKGALEQLSQSYAQRPSHPPLPEEYVVRVLPDPTKGSSKTRVEVAVADSAVADLPSAAVAWITCWPRRTRPRGDGEPATSLFLSSVEVKKAHRRRGLARALLKEVEALATETGCEETSLTVLKTNAPAIALYASCGYAVDEGAGDGAFARVANVISDPTRLMQHRMVKRLGVQR